MKKKIIFIAFLLLMILPFTNNDIYEVETNKINYQEGVDVLEQLPGTYTSTDGKTITVATDGTTKYLDTYTLTVTQAITGNTLSGKLGTNNKAATFYQLNNHIIVSGAVVNYTHNSVTEYLYDYTIFKTSKTITPDETGSFELWRNNSKVNTYKTLQDAVESASSGDTIKITKNLVVTEGTYINKNITIDGNNHILDTSKWLNSLIVLEENVVLNIKNLTIDGGAPDFKVDYDAITYSNNKIPLVSGSDTNDVKHTLSKIISKGNLNITNTKMNNITGAAGAALRILEGSLNLEKSQFNHNKGSSGGSIYIGRAFEETENEYPVKKVTMIDNEFTNNYATSNGGVIYGYNYEQLEIKNSKFLTNHVTSGKGGAIYSARSSKAEQKGLDYNKALVYNCIFDDNWAGNDGYAISNFDAEMDIEKSTFTNNKGVYASSSIGVISLEMTRPGDIAQINIKDSTFKHNYGASAVFGDHGYNTNTNFENCYFSENDASMSIYILSSKVTFKKCTFEKEKTTKAAIEIAGYSTAAEYTGLDYLGATVIVEDSNFIDNQTHDILVHQRVKDNKYEYVEGNVIINGEVNGNVSVWDGYNLTVNGTLNGDIIPDELTARSDITINGVVNGKIEDNTNKFLTTINYNTENTTHYTGYDSKYIYLENGKNYTPAEIYLLTRIDNEGYTMELYTDKNYTTPWNYTTSNRSTLYVKWVEHTHEFDGTLILDNNKIYEQCILGHFGKELSLSVPKDTTYTGKEIPIEVTNTLNISEYKITYFVKENNNWKELSSIPKEEGTYKAVLTYNDMTIEQEYNIEPKNPNTAVSIGILSFLLVSLFVSIISFNKFKTIKVRRYNN